MRTWCGKIGGLATLAAYWLAVTFAPLLHDHSHHLALEEPVAEAADGCEHDHHGHDHGDGHHGHDHPPLADHGHSHHGHHHHAPGGPQHDDDCAACQFLALKPAPAQPVAAVELRSALPQATLEVVPEAAGVAHPLPFSRAPPGLV